MTMTKKQLAQKVAELVELMDDKTAAEFCTGVGMHVKYMGRDMFTALKFYSMPDVTKFLKELGLMYTGGTQHPLLDKVAICTIKAPRSFVSPELEPDKFCDWLETHWEKLETYMKREDPDDADARYMLLELLNS